MSSVTDMVVFAVMLTVRKDVKNEIGGQGSDP